MTPIRVMIADDDAAVRESLAELVAEDPGLLLVGTAADADETILLGARAAPDVALLDVRMPGGGGPFASRELLRLRPQLRVVAYTAYEERASAIEMLRAGACSYVVKGSPIADVLAAIHLAARGQGVLAAELVPGLVGELAARLGRQDDEEAELRLQFARIRHEIDHDGADVVFQPIVDLRDGRLVGLEALTRFTAAPQRPPDAWFAEADAVGLLAELELATARRALRAAVDLPGGAYISLNLSPTTLVLERALALVSGTPERLVVEITEHAAVRNYEELDEAVRALRDRGGRLAVDDAGAGFASLRHILRLGPDIIKLDIGLTRDIHIDARRRALAAAMITFASELGAVIVAEGIESEKEVDTLRALGVPDGQGFFLGLPVAPEEIRARAGGRSKGLWSPLQPLRTLPPVTADVPAGWAETVPAVAEGPASANLPAQPFHDGLTGLWTQEACFALGEQTLALATRLGRAAMVLSVDVDNLTSINDALGQAAANQALMDVVGMLAGTFRASDVVARLGGSEFCVLLVTDPVVDHTTVVSRLRERVDAHNASAGRPYQLSLGIGAARREPLSPKTVEDLVAEANRAAFELRWSTRPRPRILIVEDDTGGRYLAEAILGVGYDLVFAADGRQALERARVEMPDLVLLDLHLPDIAGTEVARYLRADPRTASIPIVMVTAGGDASEADNLALVDDYLTKPYSPAVLALRVQKALRRNARD